MKAQTGVLETDAADDARVKLVTAVRDAVGDADEAEANWVERHLRAFVGLEGPSELSGDRRDESFAAWRRFFEGVAERGPLVLVLEDLQWADDALLDFVDHLVDWAADVPLLVVATARPELLTRRPSWGGGKANAVIQSLAPLSDEETAAFAHAILGRARPPGRSPASAGGQRRRQSALRRGVRAHADRALRRRKHVAGLPDSVQGIIAARLDALDPAEKAVLQDAAVLGKVFWVSALEVLTGEQRWRLEQRLHELERREMLRRDRQSVVAGERQFAFRHLLVRDVAYGQIPRARRAEKHAAAARWIEALSADRSADRADMLAHHWSAALQYAEASGGETTELEVRTRAALTDAGEHALKLNAPAQAADFYERAIAIGRTDDVLLRYGRSLYLATDQRAQRVLEEAREALAASGDRAGEAFAEAMLGHMAWLAGDARASSERVTRAVSMVQELPSSELKAHVLARAAGTAYVGERLDQALALAREALRQAEELGLEDIRVHSLTTIGLARWDLGDDEGRRDLERALESGVASRSPEAGRAAHNLGVGLFLRGDIAAFRQLQAEGLAYDERFGSPGLARFARGGLTSSAYMVGDWVEAQRAADAFLAECEATPHYMEPQTRVFRALMRLARDDVDGALADIERGLALLESQTDAQARAALGVVSAVFIELADPRGVPVALEALDLRFVGQPELFSIAFLPLLDLSTEVRERLREVLAEPEAGSRWLDAALHAVDGRFAEAAELFGRMPLRPAEAHARVRAAAQLVAAGRRAEADDQLQRAIAFWRSVGATRYIRQAEKLLAATA